MTSPADYMLSIDTNIDRINQNVNNIYTMLNIISNSMIINQMNEIRRPRLTPSLFTTPSSLLTPNIFSNPTNPTNSNSNSTTNPTNSTSNSTSNPTNPNSNPTNQTNPLTNLFSSMFRNEGLPSGIAMGFGNMDISVLRPPGPDQEQGPDQNIVISHHNIFNNTKIKLKTYNQNEGIELEQCTICLADIENNQIIRDINKCKHGFHIECADKWFEEHITCPHCRQDIRIEMVD
jgi:hypothetical protein